jgi:hypothetical protein
MARRRAPVGTPFFSAVAIVRFHRRWPRLALLDEGGDLPGLRAQQRATSGCSAATAHEGDAHDGVGAGREDRSSLLAADRSGASGSRAGRRSARRSLRPIQLACIVRTRSGQPAQACRARSSSSSAYAVIRR